MEFWASAEVAKPAHAALAHCERLLEAELNKALADSDLTGLKGKFRYVPIVMPPDWAVNYPPRSKLRKNEGDGVYDCAPQLNYETFIKGSFEEQMAEYTRGILMEAAQITGLGASLDQVREFEDLVITARFKIMGQPGAAGSCAPASPFDALMELSPSTALSEGGGPEEFRAALVKFREALLAHRSAGDLKAPPDFVDRFLGTLDEALTTLDEGGDVEAALKILGSVKIPGLGGV